MPACRRCLLQFGTYGLCHYQPLLEGIAATNSLWRTKILDAGRSNGHHSPSELEHWQDCFRLIPKRLERWIIARIEHRGLLPKTALGCTPGDLLSNAHVFETSCSETTCQINETKAFGHPLVGRVDCGPRCQHRPATGYKDTAQLAVSDG